MSTKLPKAVTEAIDHVCEGAVEITGCHPGYAITPERDYIAVIRDALIEAVAHVPPRVLHGLSLKLEAAADVCDANVALGESSERFRDAVAIHDPPEQAVAPVVLLKSGRKAPVRTPNGKRRGIILDAVAFGITNRSDLARHVATEMGESDLTLSRNRTNSVLWWLVGKGLLRLEGDQVLPPEEAAGATP